jgi:hypothetical protein
MNIYVFTRVIFGMTTWVQKAAKENPVDVAVSTQSDIEPGDF